MYVDVTIFNVKCESNLNCLFFTNTTITTITTTITTTINIYSFYQKQKQLKFTRYSFFQFFQFRFDMIVYMFIVSKFSFIYLFIYAFSFFLGDFLNFLSTACNI